MNLVFCTDRRMLTGLHVAAHSALAGLGESPEPVSISLFSSDLDDSDAVVLRKTLDQTFRPYSLCLHSIDGARFEGFPDLQASLATYFRLVVPEALDVDRFLYLDVDTLCRTDLRPLYQTNLNGHPIGLVPEAPIDQSADPEVARLLGGSAMGHYFNAGVMLVDAAMWRSQNITQRCLEFIVQHRPAYHDQSALNFVLHERIHSLPMRYNCRTNARENWPTLKPPLSGDGRILHFVDYPKPWGFLGEFVHPQYALWRDVLERTRLRDYRSWHELGASGIPLGRRALASYRKVFKDRLLFSAYSSGLIRKVKGVPVDVDSVC